MIGDVWLKELIAEALLKGVEFISKKYESKEEMFGNLH